jgi:colicin import membrane protein
MPVETQTWKDASKDMVSAAVRWMAEECARQNRKWNTLSDSDLIVAQGYERVEADAVARGIPVADVDVTHAELLDGMRVLARAKQADPVKAAADEAAEKKGVEDRAVADRKRAFDEEAKAEAKRVADAAATAKAEADAAKKAEADAAKKAADDKAAADKPAPPATKGS